MPAQKGRRLAVEQRIPRRLRHLVPWRRKPGSPRVYRIVPRPKVSRPLAARNVLRIPRSWVFRTSSSPSGNTRIQTCAPKPCARSATMKPSLLAFIARTTPTRACAAWRSSASSTPTCSRTSPRTIPTRACARPRSRRPRRCWSRPPRRRRRALDALGKLNHPRLFAGGGAQGRRRRGAGARRRADGRDRRRQSARRGHASKSQRRGAAPLVVDRVARRQPRCATSPSATAIRRSRWPRWRGSTIAPRSTRSCTRRSPRRCARRRARSCRRRRRSRESPEAAEARAPAGCWCATSSRRPMPSEVEPRARSSRAKAPTTSCAAASIAPASASTPSAPRPADGHQVAAKVAAVVAPPSPVAAEPAAGAGVADAGAVAARRRSQAHRRRKRRRRAEAALPSAMPSEARRAAERREREAQEGRGARAPRKPKSRPTSSVWRSSPPRSRRRHRRRSPAPSAAPTRSSARSKPSTRSARSAATPRRKKRAGRPRATSCARASTSSTKPKSGSAGPTSPSSKRCAPKSKRSSRRADPKKAATELKQLHVDWKAAGPTTKDKQEQLWQRFKAAADQVHERGRAHFAVLDEQRGANLAKKEELAARVEALADSSDWKETAELIKALQEEWKAVGPVPKDKADDVWKRFRGACDKFFDRRKAHFAAGDAERAANLAKQETLVSARRAAGRLDRLEAHRRRDQAAAGRVEDHRPGAARQVRGGVEALPRRVRHVLRRAQGRTSTSSTRSAART